VVVVGVCLLNREVCRAARLEVETRLPLLKEVRNCVFVARGSLLQRIEALEVALGPRNSDAACRGSIADIRSSSGAAGSGRGSRNGWVGIESRMRLREVCQQLIQQSQN
jgi:hypothetical protein